RLMALIICAEFVAVGSAATGSFHTLSEGKSWQPSGLLVWTAVGLGVYVPGTGVPVPAVGVRVGKTGVAVDVVVAVASTGVFVPVGVALAGRVGVPVAGRG